MSRAALTEDAAALNGTGGTLVPLGLLRYPRSADDTVTVGSVTRHDAATVAADGDTFGASDPLRMLALVEEANTAGATSFLMRPLLFAGLANARADAVTTGDGAARSCSPSRAGRWAAGFPRNWPACPSLPRRRCPATA